VKTRSEPTSLQDITALGKVELVTVAEAINGVSKDFVRGDMIAAAKRKTSDGTTVYSWDLAVAPSVCGADEQFGGALGCSYDRIGLFAAAVKNGKLVTIEVLANADEWRGKGISLRALRDSFDFT